MKKIKSIIFLVVLITGTILFSCTKEQTPDLMPIADNCNNTVTFQEEVEPIIFNNCSTTGCHDASAAGGYNLEGYTNISTYSAVILSAMRHETSTPMPLGEPKLADSLIQKFKCWIDQGTLNN